MSTNAELVRTALMRLFIQRDVDALKDGDGELTPTISRHSPHRAVARTRPAASVAGHETFVCRRLSVPPTSMV